jgi:hypothetical protein
MVQKEKFIMLIFLRINPDEYPEVMPPAIEIKPDGDTRCCILRLALGADQKIMNMACYNLTKSRKWSG